MGFKLKEEVVPVRVDEDIAERAIVKLDSELALVTISVYDGQLDKVCQMAADLEVNSDEANTKAADGIKLLNKLTKEYGHAMEELTNRAKAYYDAVRIGINERKDRIARAKKALTRKGTDWIRFQDIEREKERRRLSEEQRKRQEALNKAAAEVGKEAPVLPDPVVEAPQAVRGKHGTGYARKEWKAEITDPAAVPREYCEPVMKLINQAVRQGVRDIPGVRIYEDTQLRVR